MIRSQVRTIPHRTFLVRHFPASTLPYAVIVPLCATCYKWPRPHTWIGTSLSHCSKPTAGGASSQPSRLTHVNSLSALCATRSVLGVPRADAEFLRAVNYVRNFTCITVHCSLVRTCMDGTLYLSLRTRLCGSTSRRTSHSLVLRTAVVRAVASPRSIRRTMQASGLGVLSGAMLRGT